MTNLRSVSVVLVVGCWAAACGTNETPIGSGSGGTVGSGGKGVTGGTISTTGGAAPGTGGTTATGGLPSATGGRTSNSGGSSSGGSATGGKATGGSATGGRATGGAATGGSTSTCGSTTLNQNPFGCNFAWGLVDPGGSLGAYGYLQFMTYWVDGVTASGTFSTCNGCNWVKNNVAPTTPVPVYYAYFIGYFGHANGLVDGNQCPSSNPNCPNLTNGGAALIKANRSTIIQIYANYAQQTYAVWPTKPLVWLLEGDFIQYTASSQSSPLTMTELAQLARDITCAIKGNMPNAVVAIDHTTWNSNQQTNDFWNAMKNVGVNYDMVWTTGVANNGDYLNGDATSSTYNSATATYAYVHQLTGKKILVDDGCGGGNDTWSPASAATLNARIASGVIAFNHCLSLGANYQSLITALKPQLNSTCN
jgi:hypothetical protein